MLSVGECLEKDIDNYLIIPHFLYAFILIQYVA